MDGTDITQAKALKFPASANAPAVFLCRIVQFSSFSTIVSFDLFETPLHPEASPLANVYSAGSPSLVCYYCCNRIRYKQGLFSFALAARGHQKQKKRHAKCFSFKLLGTADRMFFSVGTNLCLTLCVILAPVRYGIFFNTNLF